MRRVGLLPINNTVLLESVMWEVKSCMMTALVDELHILMYKDYPDIALLEDMICDYPDITSWVIDEKVVIQNKAKLLNSFVCQHLDGDVEIVVLEENAIASLWTADALNDSTRKECLRGVLTLEYKSDPDFDEFLSWTYDQYSHNSTYVIQYRPTMCKARSILLQRYLWLSAGGMCEKLFWDTGEVPHFCDVIAFTSREHTGVFGGAASLLVKSKDVVETPAFNKLVLKEYGQRRATNPVGNLNDWGGFTLERV